MPETVKKTTTPSKPRKTAAKNGSSKVKTMPSAPSHEQIEELARRYWAERGYQDGHSEEDWFRAEQALRAKAS
jgi:hypothetical protein